VFNYNASAKEILLLFCILDMFVEANTKIVSRQSAYTMKFHTIFLIALYNYQKLIKLRAAKFGATEILQSLLHHGRSSSIGVLHRCARFPHLKFTASF
jgi:hypothetical protein